MAKKNEVTVEDKLRALYDLQLIDSRVDEIRNVRGELPLEVEDLENEIAGLEKRLENFNQEVSDFDFQTKEQKNSIEVAKEEFKKYEENLKNVRNNREYNSIVKEQEYQELEIQLAEKRIKEFAAKKELKLEAIGQLDEKLNERKKHLKAKKGELNEILKETEKEENILAKKATEYQGKIESHLFEAYQKIRKNVKNGMAIVAIEREASGGSYFTIPPQIQMKSLPVKKSLPTNTVAEFLLILVGKRRREKWMLFFFKKIVARAKSISPFQDKLLEWYFNGDPPKNTSLGLFFSHYDQSTFPTFFYSQMEVGYVFKTCLFKKIDPSIFWE